MIEGLGRLYLSVPLHEGLGRLYLSVPFHETAVNSHTATLASESLELNFTHTELALLGQLGLLLQDLRDRTVKLAEVSGGGSALGTALIEF